MEVELPATANLVVVSASVEPFRTATCEQGEPDLVREPDTENSYAPFAEQGLEIENGPAEVVRATSEEAENRRADR